MSCWTSGELEVAGAFFCAAEATAYAAEPPMMRATPLAPAGDTGLRKTMAAATMVTARRQVLHTCEQREVRMTFEIRAGVSRQWRGLRGRCAGLGSAGVADAQRARALLVSPRARPRQ